ncbi:hypothetical protein OIU85_019840 [Salix viminalis]|uniref:DUF4283 domain-containing protein n=1 Tax=Salix viminalis TaxID=40686 RepID=A0A9Q0ZKI1_SALVM|nr:hypothetical protein OIU85_019840 [Salix viminalis]
MTTTLLSAPSKQPSRDLPSGSGKQPIAENTMKTQTHTLKNHPAATHKQRDKTQQEAGITQKDKPGDIGGTVGLASKPPTATPPKGSGQGRDQTATWADRVRVTDSTTRHTLDPVPQKPAGSRLQIPAEMLQHNRDHWAKTMIGFFTGCRLPYHAVSLIAKKAWTRYCLEQVLTMDDGFLIFRFKTEEAITEVIEKGPWMFGGKNIILQKWTPAFQFDRSKISKLSVWIRLKGLPLPLWTKQGLSMAASMVGKLLSCDEMTINCRRLDYVRLCVELDAGLPFIHHFEMECPLLGEPLRINVEYEWKPSRCEGCKSFGHSCVKKNEVSPEGKQKDERGKDNQSEGGATVPLHNDVSPIEVILRREGSSEVSPKQDMVQPENPPTLKPNLDITQAHMARDPKGKGISTDESNSGMETQHRKGNSRETYTSSQSREEVGDDESSVHANCQASARDEDNAWSPPVVRKKKGGRKKKEARGF